MFALKMFLYIKRLQKIQHKTAFSKSKEKNVLDFILLLFINLYLFVLYFHRLGNSLLVGI